MQFSQYPPISENNANIEKDANVGISGIVSGLFKPNLISLGFNTKRYLFVTRVDSED